MNAFSLPRKMNPEGVSQILIGSLQKWTILRELLIQKSVRKRFNLLFQEMS